MSVSNEAFRVVKDQLDHARANHPCRCEVCYGARDAELRRAREGMADMLDAMVAAQGPKPPGVKLGLKIAANAVRRGRPLTEQEKMENLKAAIFAED